MRIPVKNMDEEPQELTAHRQHVDQGEPFRDNCYVCRGEKQNETESIGKGHPEDDNGIPKNQKSIPLSE